VLLIAPPAQGLAAAPGRLRATDETPTDREPCSPERTLVLPRTARKGNLAQWPGHELLEIPRDGDEFA
jgi:hypothetical protein